MVSIRLSISSIQSHLKTTINPILYSPYPRIIAQRIKKPKLNYSLSIHQPWTRKMIRIDRPSIQSNHFLRRKKKPLTPSNNRKKESSNDAQPEHSLLFVLRKRWVAEEGGHVIEQSVTIPGGATGTKTNPFRPHFMVDPHGHRSVRSRCTKRN